MELSPNGKTFFIMAKSIVSVYVRCPYYKREERKKQIKIVCEGTTEENSIHLMFESVDALKRNEDQLCKKDYNLCPIAQMLNRKYGYDIQ